jgi:glycosyltransferase involved in cell wall biosynthesis
MRRSTLSIVIPIYNEEETLAELEQCLCKAVAALGFESNEVILVSDGSRDRSEAMIARMARENPLFRGLFLTRNFGHQAAISIGLGHATGDVVVVMDGDLQDPPEAIESLIAALEAGADVAYAVRTARKENVLKRSAYMLFYRLLRGIASIDIPLDTGDFCAMKRCVLDDMLRLPERNRFVRGLRAWVGYTQVPVKYERAQRFGGQPKYDLRRLMRLAYDGLFSFSALPIRVIQTLGFVISLLAIATAVGYFLLALISGKPNWPAGFATLVISIWFLGGVQLLFMGFVGEYVHRILDEARGRPLGLIREVVGREVACKTNTESNIQTSTSSTGGGARASAS